MEVKSKALTLQCFPKSSQMVSCDCWTTSGNWISHGTPSVGLCGAARINTCHWWFQSRKPQKESRLPSDLARILSLILFVLKVVGILLSRLDICRYDPFFLRDGWKGHHIINSNPFKNVRVRDSCFFTKWRNILVLRLTKRCQGCLPIAPVCTQHRFAKMSTRRWWAIIPRGTQFVQTLWLGVHFPSVDEPQQMEKWWGMPGYPYRWWLFTSFTFSCSQNLTWNCRCPKIHANF